MKMRLVILLLGAIVFTSAQARDDGRYANSPLKPWFEQLASGKGLCCSFADGVSIKDVDWDTAELCETVNNGEVPQKQTETCDQHFRVRIDREWIMVPHSAEVTEPNRFGSAVVWPYEDVKGVTVIRCFLPGAQS